jgi:putative transposase
MVRVVNTRKRAYKYRFYPTPEQEVLLARTFGCVRKIYNLILEWRSLAYQERQEKINYLKASARLTEIKRLPEFAYLNEVSSVPLQQCLRHQQRAFTNFWEGRAKYPTFKKKHGRQSAELTQRAFSYREGKLYIAKSQDPLDVRWSRELPSAPSTLTLTKDSAGRYFVSCLCEFTPTVLSVTPNTVGVDLGIKDLFVADRGEKTGNRRHTAKYAAQLARYQRRLARKAFGSKNRAKAKHKVARIHAKISDSRMDNLHKLSRRLINDNKVVCVESLKVKNLIRNPQLSKHIADAGWGHFLRMLEYKADWAGRSLVAIDTFFPSSKRCSCCGYINDALTLNDREWTCPSCSSLLDRDINAARNIKAAGLAVLASGESVRLVSPNGMSSSR